MKVVTTRVVDELHSGMGEGRRCRGSLSLSRRCLAVSRLANELCRRRCVGRRVVDAAAGQGAAAAEDVADEQRDLVIGEHHLRRRPFALGQLRCTRAQT